MLTPGASLPVPTHTTMSSWRGCRLADHRTGWHPIRGGYARRIVDPHHKAGLLELVHRGLRNNAGNDTDDNGVPAIDVTGSGSDSGQNPRSCRDRADDRRPAIGHLVH